MALRLRAVEQSGQIIDVCLSPKRDFLAARRFFARALRAHREPVGAGLPGVRAALASKRDRHRSLPLPGGYRFGAGGEVHDRFGALVHIGWHPRLLRFSGPAPAVSPPAGDRPVECS